MTVEFPILGPDDAERITDVSAQKTVNLYLNLDYKNRPKLYSCPGLKQFALLGGIARSNGIVFGGNGYFVADDKLKQVTDTGTVTEIGTLNTSGGRCTMIAGRDYILIVDGTDGYTYDGSTFAVVSDVDIKQDSNGNSAPPVSCTYLDGYFIVNKSGTDEYAISAIEDPTSWATLDFATAASDPDDAIAVAANYKDLYVIGSRTTQLANNTGNADFPFEFYPSGTVEYGCASPYTIAQTPMGLFWLSTTKYGKVQVVQVQKLNAKPVSSGQYGIDWELSELSKVDDAIAWVYSYGEHTVYHITFPAARRSWEYFIELGSWIERESHDDYISIGRYRGAGHLYLGDKQIIADYSNGNLYEIDFDEYDEDGEILRRVRRAQAVDKNHQRVIHRSIEIEIEAGKGAVTGQGSDPQLMLRYSDDGGYTWSNELWRSAGPIGNYRYRAIWRNLGQSRERIYEIAMTDPGPMTLIKGLGRFTVCDY